MRLRIRTLRRDEEGVASTVGTIMALLVFLTFLSLIVNQYVPVWMKDTESAHMNSAIGQFGGLKGAVDLQVLAAQIAQDAGSHYIPITASSPISLGIDGVPIFSAPTVGELKVDPEAGPWTVVFYYPIQGASTKVEETSSGVVSLNVGNRYYIPGQVAYDNGAVVRSQVDGQIVRAPPVFEVLKINNSALELSFQLLALYGKGGKTGTTTEVVNAKLFGLDRQDYTGVTSSVWINHTTAYGVGWYQFFNATLSKALGVSTGTYVTAGNPITGQVFFEGKIGATSVYSVQSFYNSDTQLYSLQVKISKDAFPVSTFRFQHVYVQIGLGEETEELQF